MHPRDEIKTKILEAAAQITVAAIEKNLVHGAFGKTLTMRSPQEPLVDAVAFFEAAYKKMAELTRIEESKPQE